VKARCVRLRIDFKFACSGKHPVTANVASYVGSAGIVGVRAHDRVTPLPLGVFGVIGLSSTMTASILERTQEFGIMHAIGAPLCRATDRCR
jgi:hypothetical protein